MVKIIDLVAVGQLKSNVGFPPGEKGVVVANLNLGNISLFGPKKPLINKIIDKFARFN